MQRSIPVYFTAVVLFPLLLTSPAQAENWPGWRGPRGDGTSQETKLPISWDGESGKNVVWKVPLPGIGHASPIVWEDQVFVTSCLEEDQQRVLMCLNRQTGQTIWQRTVLRAPLETKHALNSHASGTPATDGELVIATYLEVDGSTIPAPNVSRARPVTPGQMVVAAYDMQGNRKWMVRPGSFISVHGFCSSPVLYKDLVIVNGDQDGNGYLVALRKSTGELVWRTDRPHNTRSYATPIIREVAGRTQLVLSGSKCICSYDPADGSRHWTVDGPTEQFVASMVFDGKQFYAAAGFPTHHVLAVRPDGTGNVTDSHVAWHSTKVRCYVPSPVVVGKYLIVADDRGTANCYLASSGERLWQERLGTHFSASLLTATGLVFFLADDGVTKIVKPGPELEVVSVNELGEYCYASPAISNGQILIRGERHLYCIGEG